MTESKEENYFSDLAARLFQTLRGEEILLLNYSGEKSDFVRLNRAQLRQAGHLAREQLQLILIAGQRQSKARIDLSGNLDDDVARAGQLLARQREQLPLLSDDPYLHFATEPSDSVHRGDNRLPAAQDAVAQIVDAAAGLDLVGFWAGGEIMQGFSNSLGQFNWHSSHSFNFDWSVFQENGTAIKQNQAGFAWDAAEFKRSIAKARETLGLLQRKPKPIEPGRYRVFIAPRAMEELMRLLKWGGFGLKSHRTKQTTLLKLSQGQARLDPRITMVENNETGISPPFTGSGFIRPHRVTLIDRGEYRECLANSRSAKEFGVRANCSIEHPETLELAGGQLAPADVLPALDTGIYISNLWYSNYSDRNNCRITGLTRFACLWVENGVPVAPIATMRFDESLYHMLGDRLVDLTTEREQLFETQCYNGRSNDSMHLPGALVDGFTLVS